MPSYSYPDEDELWLTSGEDNKPTPRVDKKTIPLLPLEVEVPQVNLPGTQPVPSPVPEMEL